MEWMLVALGTAAVGALATWLARRGRADRSEPLHRPSHASPSRTRGIEDSMSMRLPTGGNSGT